MKRNAFRSMLFLGLCATLLAAYFAPPQAGEAIVLSERAKASTLPVPQSTRREPAAPATEVLAIKSRDIDQPDDDPVSLFASRSAPVPKVAPPPIVASAPALPPAAPQAPPLPFKVLGRFAEGEDAGVFLQLNDQNLVVRVGDTIGEHYKVESLNGPILSLRYAPLNLVQTLDVGGTN